MASVNRVILLGHLGADPEVRSNPSGEIATLRLATSETYKDKSSGEQKQNTEWHRCVLFGKLAEIARDHLKKGAQVYIEGNIKTRTYDKDGETRYVTEIRVQNLTMVTRGGGGNGGDGGDTGYQHPQRPAAGARRPPAARPAASTQGGGGGQTGFDDMDDDIPFVGSPLIAYDPDRMFHTMPMV